MERETKKIVLPQSKLEVEIVTYLTWGEKEKVQDVIMSGANIEDAKNGKIGFDTGAVLKSKYALLEIAVKSIKNGDENINYSKDWIDNLSSEDGDYLMNELDEIGKKK